ncbi:MAG: energy-coupling factor transporter transmembrane component T family protein [Christensenellales bacterium]|jgi:energy-coupling factor transport system permease protein
MILGQYYPGKSPVHRMDPRMKISLVLFYIILIFFVKSFVGYAFFFGFLFGAIAVAKVPVKMVLKSLKPLYFIIAFTFVLNVFFTPGEHVIWKWGIIKLTWEGLRQAVFMGIRLMLLVTGTSILTLTTSPVALTDGIERLLSPLKKLHFPVHELAMMMTIALRFIPTLLEETNKIMRAQMARGADFDSGKLMQRVKSMVPLLVPLFISAFRRADELALAMEARCYRGGEGRTRMKVLKLGKVDYIALCALVGLTALVALDRVFF